MNLSQKIKEDLTNAVKERRELDSLVLRQLLAAILNKEKEKRYKLTKSGVEGKELEGSSRLLDEEVLEVVQYEAKKRRESISEFEKGKREDLVKKEKAELEVLKSYLPVQLSDEEVKQTAQGVIQQLGAATPKDTGKVMAELMPKLKGRADGNQVSRIVKELLS